MAQKLGFTIAARQNYIRVGDTVKHCRFDSCVMIHIFKSKSVADL